MVALVAGVLAIAGCSGGDEPTPPGAAGSPSATTATGSPGASPGAPGPSQPAVPANTGEVCAAARQASTEAGRTFIAEYGRALQALAGGDQSTAVEAQRAATAALATWERRLREQAGRATDAELKRVLLDTAAVVKQMQADLDSVDQAKLDSLDQRLTAACG